MASWTHEEELALVTSVVDAMKGRQPGQTRYWPEAFATYQHNVRHDRHNLNACQHKWRELRPKLDRFYNNPRPRITSFKFMRAASDLECGTAR
ncbi:hypothetical protein HanRHA438_Chr17g0814571 [Helianthus annuus]|nr:hypothetical protein HanRHA438_Chr17g0814571 [Helianthus annuus]